MASSHGSLKLPDMLLIKMIMFGFYGDISALSQDELAQRKRLEGANLSWPMAALGVMTRLMWHEFMDRPLLPRYSRQWVSKDFFIAEVMPKLGRGPATELYDILHDELRRNDELRIGDGLGVVRRDGTWNTREWTSWICIDCATFTCFLNDAARGLV